MPWQCSSAAATPLQRHADETNRGRIMALFGLIGLGSDVSFSFWPDRHVDRSAVDRGVVRPC
jgi:hypothetical protein